MIEGKITGLLIEEAKDKLKKAMHQELEWKGEEYVFMLSKTAVTCLARDINTIGIRSGLWMEGETMTLLGIPIEIVGEGWEIRLLKEIK